MPQIDPMMPGYGTLPNGIELIVLGLEVSAIGLLGQMGAVQRQIVVQDHQNWDEQHLGVSHRDPRMGVQPCGGKLAASARQRPTHVEALQLCRAPILAC